MILLNNDKTLDSLKRYYKTLESAGYASIKATSNVLALTFMNEWVNTDMNYFVDEESYNKIAKAIRNITGDCMIPYSSYCTRVTKIGSPMPMNTNLLLRNRQSQTGDSRYAETSELRISEGATTLDS